MQASWWPRLAARAEEKQHLGSETRSALIRRLAGAAEDWAFAECIRLGLFDEALAAQRADEGVRLWNLEIDGRRWAAYCVWILARGQGQAMPAVARDEPGAQAADAASTATPMGDVLRVYLSCPDGERERSLTARLALELQVAGLEARPSWNTLLPGPPARGIQGGVALEGVTVCLFLVGADGGLSEAQRADLERAHAHAARGNGGTHLVAVLLPTAPGDFEAKLLPPPLDGGEWVDLRPGPDAKIPDARLNERIRALASDRLRFTSPPAGLPREGVAPYIGLRPFERGDAGLFFGREADTLRLLEKLREARFLAVVAPSGIGKSSLVEAGLVHRLRRGALPGSERWLIPPSLRPGTHPVQALAAALASLGASDSVEVLTRRLLESDEALHREIERMLDSRPHIGRVLWVVDQLEETFTECEDRCERARFIGNLMRAASPSGGPTMIVVTLRADYIARCTENRTLATAVADHQHPLGEMDLHSLRQAIEEPARRFGVRFEAGLVDAILGEAATEPRALPLLEHALLELYLACEGAVLTHAAYERIGGVPGAVARWAQKSYDELAGRSPTWQGIARRILVGLVNPGEVSDHDTRRRMRLADVVGRDAPEDVQAVVGHLVQHRLLTTSLEERTGYQLVELAHEALIRAWPSLREWVGKDRHGLRAYRRLQAAVAEWERLGRSDHALYFDEQQLDEVVGWCKAHEAELNHAERAFLDRSSLAQAKRRRAEAERQREAEERRQRELEDLRRIAAAESARAATERRGALRLKWGIAVVAALLLITVGAALWGGHERGIAQSRELAAAAMAQLPSDPELSVLLALEAAKISRTEQAEHALRRSLSESHLERVLRGHSDSVRTVRFSPDGRRVLTTSRDGTARLWDVETGQAVVELQGHADVVTDGDFSHDGRLIVTTSFDGTARVWESSTGRAVSTFDSHSDWLGHAEFSADDRLVVTAGGSRVEVFDSRTGTLIAELGPHGSFLTTNATFAPDGRLLVTTSYDGVARVWERREEAFELRATLPTGQSGNRTLTAFSHDGRQLATVSASGSASIWDLATSSPISEIQDGELGSASQIFFDDLASTSAILTMRVRLDERPVSRSTGYQEGRHRPEFLCRRAGHDAHESRRGSLSGSGGLSRKWRKSSLAGTVVGISMSGRVFKWAYREATPHPSKYALQGYSDVNRVWSYTAGPNDVLVSAGEDGAARIWSADGTQLRSVLRGHTGDVVSVAVSRDGGRVVTGGVDGTARIWRIDDIYTSTVLRDDAGDRTEAVEFNPDGRFLVTANGPRARIWDARSGELSWTLQGHAESIERVAFDPTGNVLVTAGGDQVHIWHVRTGGHLAGPLPQAGGVTALAFSPDGVKLAVGNSSGTVLLWDLTHLDAGSFLFGHSSRILDVAFASSGARMIVLAEGGVTTWNVATRSQGGIAALRGHTGPVLTGRVSPDGMLAATGGADGTARVWDIRTGSQLQVLLGHRDNVTHVAFSPDSRLLVTAANGSRVMFYDTVGIVWQARTGRGVSVFRGHRVSLFDAQFSPDGRLVVSTSWDRTARIWNGETGEELAVLRGHTSWAGRARFSPDGRLVATGSSDGTARTWACAVCGSLDDLVHLAKQRVTRALTSDERARYLHKYDG